MAKRGTAEHPKTRRLAGLLQVEPWAALGLMEAVWHWVAVYARQGALTDQQLDDCAWHIRFSAGGVSLRKLLCEAGLLDPRPDGAWWVHDWHEHADDSVKKNLQRRGLRFANGSLPYEDPRVSAARRDKPAECRDKAPESRDIGETVTGSRACMWPEPEPEPEPETMTMAPAGPADGRRPTPPAPSPNTPPPGYQAKLGPHRQQAADLWQDGGSQALFRWCGDVAGEAYQRWLDAAEAWLKAGLPVDLAFCERVTAETWTRYQAKGSQGPKTLQWWLNTANDLAIEPPPAAEKPAAPPVEDYWRRPTEIPQVPPRRSTPPPRDRGTAAPAGQRGGLDVDAALRDGPGSEAWRKLPLAVRKALRARYDAQRKTAPEVTPDENPGGLL